jgi:GH43 family beta-xylosidase
VAVAVLMRVAPADPRHAGVHRVGSRLFCALACTLLVWSTAACSSSGGGHAHAHQVSASDTRCALHGPLLDGADPSVAFLDGRYYLVQSDGQRSITVTRASSIAGLGRATPVTVWTAPTGTGASAETWAPEIEHIEGHWYIYFAAATDFGGDPETNDTHRLFVLSADGDDPLGSWTFEGRLQPHVDEWAIDPSVFRHGNRLWLLWSGTPHGNGGDPPQQIFLARMSGPLRATGPAIRLATPDRPWERSVQAIEEGPEPWVGPGGTLTIVYNANASWTRHYALGALVHRSGPLITASSYQKRGPVLSSANGLYGPGGESLPVRGPGGRLWTLFHAKTTKADGWDDRKIFAQPVSWASDGTPRFVLLARDDEDQKGRTCP